MIIYWIFNAKDGGKLGGKGKRRHEGEITSLDVTPLKQAHQGFRFTRPNMSHLLSRDLNLVVFRYHPILKVKAASRVWDFAMTITLVNCFCTSSFKTCWLKWNMKAIVCQTLCCKIMIEPSDFGSFTFFVILTSKAMVIGHTESHCIATVSQGMYHQFVRFSNYRWKGDSLEKLFCT